MIKALPLTVVRERVEGQTKGNARETRRGAARPQEAEGGNTHDRAAVRNQAADAFPDRPDKRHLCTPQFMMLLPKFWFAAAQVFLGR